MLNPVRAYPWGSTTSFPRLFGTDPDGPQAELWMGAHPTAPSSVVVQEASGETLPLDALISQRPELVQHRGTLPFLVKVIAAEQPLSIQVHPNLAQAKAGFAAEEAAGIPPDSALRNYPDPRHKPELVVAVEDFTVLCGFRPAAEAAAEVAVLNDALQGATGQAPEAMTAESAGTSDDVASARAGLSELHRLLERADLAGALALILRDEPDLFSRAAELVADLLRDPQAASRLPLSESTRRTLVHTSAAFPGDPGVLVTLLLNRVDLAPGQGLYLPAGNLHAYLHGVAVEIMANSDNVVRGGLTTKHVDVEELLAVTEPAVLPVPWCEAESGAAGRKRYRPPVEEFQLERLELGGDDAGAVTTISPEGPTVLLCLNGEVDLCESLTDMAAAPERASSWEGSALRLHPGESAFLPPGGSVELRCTSPSTAYLAAPGSDPG